MPRSHRLPFHFPLLFKVSLAILGITIPPGPACRAASGDGLRVVAYTDLSPTQPYTFSLQLAFWRDPDTALLLERHDADTLVEKLNQFAGRLREELGDNLAQAGIGEFSISLIEDYNRLMDERTTGTIDLLMCEPGVFVLGRNYLQGVVIEDLYEVLLEEAPAGRRAPAEAAIWTRNDSEIRALKDLEGRHVALVHPAALLGGALQRAALAGNQNLRLHPGSDESGGNYQVTACGSVSDAVFRLITGLATDRPIEAAFLPFSAPGFLLALTEMGLETEADLPIRALETFKAEEAPGSALLLNRILARRSPDLVARISDVLIAEHGPFRWRRPDWKAWDRLRETLAPQTPPLEPRP
ncbi:MAG: hypothetical protein GHCLOJNM_04040 [bacterium]|nr:hypothetical protein [bacterium]